MTVIIDYGMGNVGSIANMLKKIGQSCQITADVDIVKKAERLILPGVGAFDNGMRNLEKLSIIDIIRQKVRDGTPLLGICLGMQLLSNQSEEGVLSGLELIDAETVKFKADEEHKLKVPHMGWNTVKVCSDHPLFTELAQKNRFYFVHSYHVVCKSEENVLTKTEYGVEFNSTIYKKNIFGVQFHPEKSHRFGMQLLRNFTNLEFGK